MSTYQLKNWETLTWKRSKDNRFYTLFLHQDLWCNWILTRAWGRVGTKRGGSKAYAIGYEEGLELIKKFSKIRSYRKYEKLQGIY